MSIVLTNSAKFTPFTFDEIIKPYQMVTEEYNAIEAGLSDLDNKAEIMRQYAEEAPNEEWAKKYLNYANEIDKEAEELAKNGLTPSARSRLLGLNRQYNSVVAPIEQGVKKLEEMNKYRDTLYANSKGKIRWKKPKLTLSDVMGTNTPDNEYIDLDDLATQAATLTSSGVYSEFNRLLQEGKTYDEAIKSLNNLTSTNNMYTDIITSLYPSAEYDAYDADILDALARGYSAGIAKLNEGEHLTRAEREQLALSRSSNSLQVANFNMNLEKLGKSRNPKTGNIEDDYTLPYWAHDAKGNVMNIPGTDTPMTAEQAYRLAYKSAENGNSSSSSNPKSGSKSKEKTVIKNLDKPYVFNGSNMTPMNTSSSKPFKQVTFNDFKEMLNGDNEEAQAIKSLLLESNNRTYQLSETNRVNEENALLKESLSNKIIFMKEDGHLGIMPITTHEYNIYSDSPIISTDTVSTDTTRITQAHNTVPVELTDTIK